MFITNATGRWAITNSGTFYPAQGDNILNIGSAANRVANVYTKQLQLNDNVTSGNPYIRLDWKNSGAVARGGYIEATADEVRFTSDQLGRSILVMDWTTGVVRPGHTAGGSGLGSVAIPWGDTYWGDGTRTIRLLAGSPSIGTRSNHDFGLVTNDTYRWLVQAAGHLVANVDNTYDIGASGANRPRNVYIAGNLVVGGTFSGVSLVSTLYQNGSINTSSTTDVSLASYSLPSGTLGTNFQKLRITINYNAINAGAQLNIKFGATQVCGIAPAANVSGTVQIIITRQSASTQTAYAMCVGSSLVVGDDVNVRSTPAETLSGAVTIDFRGNALATGTLFYEAICVELLP